VNTISVDLAHRIGRIDRFVYGHFIEHLERCIYGGIYDPGSPRADARGFRTDVIEAVREMTCPILRWPGGNFVSAYHWEDGVGPRENRPRRWDPAWRVEESNAVGTDEFIAYCRAVDAEPYICINLGTGSPEEAARWVEYCNATTDTSHANLRRANGHAEPFHVTYWGLGNELYGDWQIGHKTAEEYAREARRAAKIMLAVDPDIKLIACGANDPDWDRVVLRHLYDVVDYIAIHHYTRPGRGTYEDEVGSPAAVERWVRHLAALIDIEKRRRATDHEVAISFDEWNAMWARRGPDRHDQTYTVAEMLFVASFLTMLQRSADVVTMGNLAQMVNVIAPIMTRPDAMFLQTIYWPLMLFATRCEPVALDVVSQGDSFDAPLWRETGLPYLDAGATSSEDGSRLVLTVVNRHADEALAAEVRLLGVSPTGEMRVCEVAGPSLDAANAFDEPDVVVPASATEPAPGSTFIRTFPAHSLTLIELNLT